MFLSWCGARVRMDLSPLWWWLSPIYSGLGPLPKYEREGIPQWRDLKGTSSTVYPDKSSLRLRKASGRDAAVGSMMTSVLPSWRSWFCCTRMETFG